MGGGCGPVRTFKEVVSGVLELAVADATPFLQVHSGLQGVEEERSKGWL